MNANPIDIESDVELQGVLWACHKYWKGEPLPPEQRIVCYSWVIDDYRNRFGRGFHQTKLYWLAKLGFLKQDSSSRGQSRRYYKLTDPIRVENLLAKWRLN